MREDDNPNNLAGILLKVVMFAPHRFKLLAFGDFRQSLVSQYSLQITTSCSRELETTIIEEKPIDEYVNEHKKHTEHTEHRENKKRNGKG